MRVQPTLLRPMAGRAGVLGFDVVADPLAGRRPSGLAGRFASVVEELTGRENVEMVARLYRLSGAEAQARAGEVLERFGLAEAADRRVSTYSGGMRRRLDLGASLVGRRSGSRSSTTCSCSCRWRYARSGVRDRECDDEVGHGAGRAAAAAHACCGRVSALTKSSSWRVVQHS